MIKPLFDHLLVPTDGSKYAVEAGRLAFRVTRAHDARVTLLHVIDDTSMGEMARVSKKSRDDVRGELESAGRGYLHHLSKMAEESGVEAQTEMREGEPHKVIVDVAREVGVDLIVMGHVGQRGPRRVLIGSVTERVLRFAECPVLVT